MARIAGVDLPSEKRIEVALTYIFGIGPSTAKRILSSTGVRPEVRVKNLTDEDTGKLRTIIEREYKVEGALRSEVAMNIKRLMDIGAYRGLRHRRGLPVRGQRTKTNARTRKGPKKTAGAMRKTVTKAPAAAPAAPAEDDDDLPQPGRVWEDKGGPSLAELMKRADDAKPSVPAPAPEPVANVVPVDAKDLAAVMARHPSVRHLRIEDGRGRPLGRSFRVKLWPTLIFMDGGVEKGRVVRPGNASEIEAIFAN